MLFELKADARFEAEDLDDAFEKLVKHFYNLSNDVDSDEFPLEFTGEISLKKVEESIFDKE